MAIRITSGGVDYVYSSNNIVDNGQVAGSRWFTLSAPVTVAAGAAAPTAAQSDIHNIAPVSWSELAAPAPMHPVTQAVVNVLNNGNVDIRIS